MRQILIYKLVIAIAKRQRAKILPINEHIKPPLFDPKWPYWHLASKFERAVMGVSDRHKDVCRPRPPPDDRLRPVQEFGSPLLR